MPKVSVIIPCYNHGKFIHEAIDSVMTQTFQDFEIVIVNDGSTDAETNEIISKIDLPKTKVIVTENQGLPSARNNGIKAAQGEYILPLDADDKLHQKFLEKAVTILDKNKNVGIVCCKFKAFGAENWIGTPNDDVEKLIVENSIIASSMFRKTDWEKAGHYKTNMKYGWEDYDMWLSIIELERKIAIIQEILFYYRKHTPENTGRQYSLASIDKDKQVYLQKQIIKNHPKLFAKYPDALVKYIVEQKQVVQYLSHKIDILEKQLQKRTLANLPFLIAGKIKKAIK